MLLDAKHTNYLIIHNYVQKPSLAGRILCLLQRGVKRPKNRLMELRSKNRQFFFQIRDEHEIFNLVTD